jgi:hypothetical protein
MMVCEIMETSAGVSPARAACSSCTAQASLVGSGTPSISIPVSLVKIGKMCSSKLSLK